MQSRLVKKRKKNVITLKKLDYIKFDSVSFNKLFREAEEKKDVKYLQVSDNFIPEKDNAYFFKYLDLESALLSLRGGNLRFVEPTRWEDKFEGRFYNANYNNVSTNPDDTPFLYACCMAIKPHNEAAWKVYSYGKVGLGAHCVQFKINRNKFRKELLESISIEKGFAICEGLVTYTSESIISDIHKPSYKKNGVSFPNVNYNTFFTAFGLNEYLNLLLLKRDYFKHENEVRFFVLPSKAPQQKSKLSRKYGKEFFGISLDVKIDWANVIDEIRIDSNCTQLEYDIFKDACLELLKSSKRYTSCKKKRDLINLEHKFTPIKTNIYGKRHSVTIE